MAEVTLYDSAICRLCAENNGNGEFLYGMKGDEQDLSSMVNRYLPIKICDDGKLPRTICPGCNIQLEATIQFFELLVDGQRKIRDMWKQQVDVSRKSQRERARIEKESTETADENPKIDNYYDGNMDQQMSQQIIIKILPDGSMYAAEHDMSLQMQGLDKPKRKRGRPAKNLTDLDSSKNLMMEDAIDGASQEDEEKLEDEGEEIDGDGRRRRKRKIPKRFSEAVQGKELERIFKEEGVFDDDDDGGDNAVDYAEERLKAQTPENHEEIIGHLESEEGKDLGELVIVNRVRGRGRPKLRRRKNRFTCNLCGRGFPQRSRYIMHKSFHKGVKYECSACKKQFTSKDNCTLHQKTLGHTGQRIVDGNEVEETNVSVDSTNLEEITIEKSEASVKSEASMGENPSVTNPLGDDTSLEKIDEEPEETDNFEDVSESSEKKVPPQAQVTTTKNSKRLDCETCNRVFVSKELFEVHLKTVHNGDNPFGCIMCNKTFVYHASLKEHMLSHEPGVKSGKEYPCDICGKVLNHPSSVIYHKEAEHNGRRFVCNKCGKSFKHKQLLQRHQLVHSDDRPYVCGSCNASFKTKANLINHQFTHTGEKKYSCDLCGQQFAHKTSLTLHYRWHTGNKPYSCEVCNKSFSQNGNLNEHMRIHTGEKPFCCDHCGRKFTTSSQFKLHVKRHTGERPWKCEFCAKTFLHKDTWKCHVRRHKGERPFQCAHCNRGFTEQWALKKHLRLHTGEKPYSCEFCGKAFADCSNLTKHKKVHRGDKSLLGDGLEKVPEGGGELWQILPTSNDGDEHSLGEQITQVIAGDETSEDGIPQIIYVSYQDPDDPNESRTLHFVDVAVMEEKDGEMSNVTAEQSLPTLDSQDSVSGIDEQAEESTEEDSPREIDMELGESNLQLQITDEDGNPIPLSIQDARRLLADGRFVSQLNDGQAIRISEELAQQLNAQADENDGIVNIETGEGPASPSILPATNRSDADSIVKALEDDDADTTNIEALDEMTGEAEIEDGPQTIEFTTQDGQKVRLVTSYHVDPAQLASEYLTIV